MSDQSDQVKANLQELNKPNLQDTPEGTAVNGDVKLERSMLRVQIKKILCDAILKGELKPGDRVVETRIARDLSVSQAPVREAILELEQIGLVTIRPYQGAFVHEPTGQDIRDAYSLRALLESEAAREACRVINEAELKELLEALEKMVDLAEKGDTQEYINWDIYFHERIMQVAGNRLMLKFWKQIRMSNTTYTTLKFSKRNLIDFAVSHKEIYEALKERKGEQVGEIMYRHIKDVMEDVLNNMEEEHD